MVLWGDVYCNDSTYLISKVCIPEGTSIAGSAGAIFDLVVSRRLLKTMRFTT